MKTFLCRQLGACAETEKRIDADDAESAAREFARREFETVRLLGREPGESIHVFAARDCFEISPELKTVNRW